MRASWTPASWSVPEKEEDEHPSEYPRPPAMLPCEHHVRVEVDGEVLVETRRSYRMLETHHAPAFYLDPRDVNMQLLEEVPAYSTFCEWKGSASYFDVKRSGGQVVEKAVWTYHKPSERYAAIKDHIAVYANKPGIEVSVNGEKIDPMDGSFYGGWIYGHLKKHREHIKGRPGTRGW